MQIKTKPRYHFLPNILANSKNLTTYTIGEALGKQALSHNSGRKKRKRKALPIKNLAISSKITQALSFDPAIPFLGIYPKSTLKEIQNDVGKSHSLKHYL